MSYREQRKLQIELNGALDVLVQHNEAMCNLYFDKGGRCFKRVMKIEGEPSIPTIMNISDFIAWITSTKGGSFIVSEYH